MYNDLLMHMYGKAHSTLADCYISTSVNHISYSRNISLFGIERWYNFAVYGNLGLYTLHNPQFHFICTISLSPLRIPPLPLPQCPFCSGLGAMPLSHRHHPIDFSQFLYPILLASLQFHFAHCSCTISIHFSLTPSITHSLISTLLQFLTSSIPHSLNSSLP